MTGPVEPPAYPIEVVAREAMARDMPSGTRWEDLSETERAGFEEAARMILPARGAQSDIKS